jgi:hypothetical protein
LRIGALLLGGILSLGGCVKMLDVKITNNYPFAVSVGYRFKDTAGRNVVQEIGTLPAQKTGIFNKAIPRGKSYPMEVCNSTGIVVATIIGPGNTPSNSRSDDTWSLVIGP